MTNPWRDGCALSSARSRGPETNYSHLHVSCTEQQEQDRKSTAATVDKLIETYFPIKDKSARTEISPFLTRLMTVVIVLNCVQVGAECQWQRHEYPSLNIAYFHFDLVFTVLFTLEVYVKVKKLGWSRYFASWWNVLDFVLTLSMLFDLIVLATVPFQTVAELALTGHVHSFGRTARLLRCLRLVRVLRLLKAQAELVIVVEGLRRSASTLLWVLASLVLIMYVFAVFFVLHVDHNIYAAPGMGEDSNTCEKDEHFCNLANAMNTLLDVVVGAEWSSIVTPMMDNQPWLMVPFVLFFLMSSFGVVNVIVGVIVDATAETKTHIEWQKKRECLREASTMWFERINDAGLSKESLEAANGKEREQIKAQRIKEIEHVVQHIIDSNVIEFPQGVRAKTVISLLMRDEGGILNHEDFTISLGRLLLADQASLTLLHLVNQAKEHHLVREFRKEVNGRLKHIETKLSKLDRIEAMLASIVQKQ
eukprot:TRINITY_DN38997_c0_g1_i1.p1 TRINITY_DN38997_c0_g1~~TRINITY_DN38997_c0_g1_i1.p1  ORF type:complete len:478 (-),score=114.99 TRINITY_DN38997_c0_g1_i1:197-1630(-)